MFAPTLTHRKDDGQDAVVPRDDHFRRHRHQGHEDHLRAGFEQSGPVAKDRQRGERGDHGSKADNVRAKHFQEMKKGEKRRHM
jgi:hypothetical protein